jgi:hypothetical protein
MFNEDNKLKRGAFLSRTLKENVIKGVPKEQANNVYAGYCEGFLMYLAARIPEVRAEIEQRIVYEGFKNS